MLLEASFMLNPILPGIVSIGTKKVLETVLGPHQSQQESLNSFSTLMETNCILFIEMVLKNNEVSLREHGKIASKYI